MSKFIDSEERPLKKGKENIGKNYEEWSKKHPGASKAQKLAVALSSALGPKKKK